MVDKDTILQVICGLMQRPQYLDEVDKYSLTPNDFSCLFEKYIFAAIVNLHKDGAEKIGVFDIDNYLNTHKEAKVIFEQNNGIEYLQDALDFCNPDNFPFYYKRLKKFNLLKQLKKEGYDTSRLYEEDLSNPHAKEINDKFEDMDVPQILDALKKRLMLIETNFSMGDATETMNAADGINNLVTELQARPEIGSTLQGDMFNTICRGARKTKFYIRSASSGTGKALPNSILIPTPRGWRSVGSIKVGDYLFDAFGKPTKVLGVFPQGTKEIYNVNFKDGRQAHCCKDHLWSYCTSKEQRKFYTNTLQEIIEGKSKCGQYNVLVPMNKAVEYEEQKHDVSPYTFGLTLRDRDIPRTYLEDSIKNRTNLLCGLIDSNGSVDSKGRIVYSASSKKLADTIKELCLSLGFFAKISVNYKIQITGRSEDKLKLLEFSKKKELIMNWYSSNNEEESNEFNPIKSIEATGKYEEMTCFFVDNEEHLFLTEDFIVTHNTRMSVGDACMLAYPLRFNRELWEWELTGSSERTLYIATEQEAEEIQTLVLAYLTGINEENILYGHYTTREYEVVAEAIHLMNYFKDNLKIVRLSNPSISQIRAVVRQNWLLYDIKNVFYDYIFSSPSLLNEFRDLHIREDVCLNLLSTALKDLAVEMDLFVMSSTQTNAKADGAQAEGVKNESVIRGARSIIDKCDIACVISRITKEEEERLSVLNIDDRPNQVTDVYKVRRGKYTNVRIWSQVDLGTCRKKDLFITDTNMNLLKDFEFIQAEFEDFENEKEILSFKKQLNHDLKTQGHLTQMPKLDEGVREEIDLDEIKTENQESANSLFGGLL